ncbi:MAG: hypothetical protein JWO32_1164 [Bacteroidetes bacterium]|nr:hypothetical protein [Bacteroidota bacterium]
MRNRGLIKRELSSAGSEHLPYKQRVTGSNPVVPTTMTRVSGVYRLRPFFICIQFAFDQEDEPTYQSIF